MCNMNRCCQIALGSTCRVYTSISRMYAMYHAFSKLGFSVWRWRMTSWYIVCFFQGGLDKHLSTLRGLCIPFPINASFMCLFACWCFSCPFFVELFILVTFFIQFWIAKFPTCHLSLTFSVFFLPHEVSLYFISHDLQEILLSVMVKLCWGGSRLIGSKLLLYLYLNDTHLRDSEGIKEC